MYAGRRGAVLRIGRKGLAAGGVLAVVAALLGVTAGPAQAANFSGGFSPRIIAHRADLNGDFETNGRDDSNGFFGDTDIIDGYLDCNSWGSTQNAGTDGDHVIDAADDCQLVAYDGTADGVTINVVDGKFQWHGQLPTVYNASNPQDNNVSDADFAWSTINGRVDSNGDEQINANDCTFGLIGETNDPGFGDPTDGADILGNTQSNTNPCGFAHAPSASNNGLVDLNSDGNITSADSCTNGCFFGHNLSNGFVMATMPGQFQPAPQGAFTGGFSPTIVGGRADLNGGGANGRDDSNDFFGDTDIIDGFLDCNSWGSTKNAGTDGDHVIDSNDDCTLIGYDGTADGVRIDVVDGEFQHPNGPLPTVYNASNPGNSDVGDADFAWEALGGRVDSNGDESISADDCHFGLIGETNDTGFGDPTDGADILGNDSANSNPCGAANPSAPSENGLVDLNSDGNADAADSCNKCFFGHDLHSGFVMASAPKCPGHESDPRNQVVGTPGDDVLTGTTAGDVICGLGGNDTINGRGGNDLLLGGSGNDVLTGRGGNDTLVGGGGNDSAAGGSGADSVQGRGGSDTLSGGGGKDTLLGGHGADVLRGGDRADVLRGNGGNDRLYGEGGNDRLYGGAGRDRLVGGDGADLLNGGPGFDIGIGGPGRDTFRSIERKRQ
jgi:Ca2+-binding RTX toxin-like protein